MSNRCRKTEGIIEIIMIRFTLFVVCFTLEFQQKRIDIPIIYNFFNIID